MADTFIVDGVLMRWLQLLNWKYYLPHSGFANGLMRWISHSTLAQRCRRSFRVKFCVSILICRGCHSSNTFSMIFCRQILEVINTSLKLMAFMIDGHFCGNLLIYGVFNLLSNIFCSIGDAKRHCIPCDCCIMNIILDVVFIVGSECGVEGAGYATFFLKYFRTACIIYIWKKILF